MPIANAYWKLPGLLVRWARLAWVDAGSQAILERPAGTAAAPALAYTEADNDADSVANADVASDKHAASDTASDADTASDDNAVSDADADVASDDDALADPETDVHAEADALAVTHTEADLSAEELVDAVRGVGRAFEFALLAMWAERAALPARAAAELPQSNHQGLGRALHTKELAEHLLPVAVLTNRRTCKIKGPAKCGAFYVCAASSDQWIMNATSRSATMLSTLIIGLMAGPAVSLYGSPTVSPVTAALCASEPLPPL